MPYCRHCHKEISKFDSDMCPHCGGKDPIDDGYATMDITQNIKLNATDYKLYKSKSRKAWLWFAALLGTFGIHDFYLGFWKKGLAKLISTIVLVGIAFLGFYFFPLPIENGLLIGTLGVYGVLFVIYAVVALIFLRGIDSPKDAEGEFLR